jgi:hypothetical protein
VVGASGTCRGGGSAAAGVALLAEQQQGGGGSGPCDQWLFMGCK